MEQIPLFANVLLPLPVPGTFTYRVPYELEEKISRGKRAVVQFGKKKIYTALVLDLHRNIPKDFAPKYILSVLDEAPITTKTQIEFWNWIATYYLCYPGEVMNAALPSGLKLASETRISINPDFDGDLSNLNEKEYAITDALQNKKALTLTEVANITGQVTVMHIIRNMLEKGVIDLEEELRDRYKPRIEQFIQLGSKYVENEEDLKEVFGELEKKAFRQLEILMAFLKLTQGAGEVVSQVSRSLLLKEANASLSSLRALLKKGVFEEIEKESSRLEYYDKPVVSPDEIEFSPAQHEAIETIEKTLSGGKPALLHGVTSSGKTEIYIRLIAQAIAKGKQVLYLLPEIALTAQIINRLRKYFGNSVGVYHSKYNDAERVEIWKKIVGPDEGDGKFRVILGARSSVFLPFQNLGLIIVDEEHDNSYKQYDPAPRYHAGDAALYLAHLHSADILLGSATPSLESYFNAMAGKYQLAELHERFGGVMLPEILVADVKKEARRKTMKSHFSSFLLDHIREALENREQVILFQNRRGFSLRIECDTCNWMPECKNCDVTMIYHKKSNHLRCHYCGYTSPVPARCGSCGGTHLVMRGFGTEKVEEELALIFPDINIVRMDLDTTRSRNAYQKIINDFEDRAIDVLVGTQMVTKGLDFENVSVVGVLNADNMIRFPDFRSFERSFQMMVQVSGRAGRKSKRGKVIIQTYMPYHSVIRYVIDHNFEAMYTSQLMERKKFKYPPYYRLIQISLKHANRDLLNKGSAELAQMLRKTFGKRILGPEYPLVARIKNRYIKNILIKLERNTTLPEMKQKLTNVIDNFNETTEFRAIRIIIDVDPR